MGKKLVKSSTLPSSVSHPGAMTTAPDACASASASGGDIYIYLYLFWLVDDDLACCAAGAGDTAAAREACSEALFTHYEIQPDILLKNISPLFSLVLCQWWQVE